MFRGAVRECPYPSYGCGLSVNLHRARGSVTSSSPDERRPLRLGHLDQGTGGISKLRAVPVSRSLHRFKAADRGWRTARASVSQVPGDYYEIAILCWFGAWRVLSRNCSALRPRGFATATSESDCADRILAGDLRCC
jgi:hypothetical protein